jgi:hypothetical protein
MLSSLNIEAATAFPGASEQKREREKSGRRRLGKEG